MRYRTIIALALLFLPLSIQAQRRARTIRKPKVEAPAEDPRITQMRASTQKVTFIDSLVVDKASFLSHIPLSPYSGSLSQQSGLGTFVNEMGDHRLAAVWTNDTTPNITGSDFLAGKWSEAAPLGGIGSDASNYPFLMPDGITLYFAQKGEKSIGGYDIFVTRYDSERATFLKPENLGMPFASKANDLFYAIDEFNQLGYFVTDRRQPAGKVCIYTFIPQETRRTYPTEAYSEEKMRSLAELRSIADTWTQTPVDERRQATQRLETARAASSEAVGGFKANKELDEDVELAEMRQREKTLQETLNMAREMYATATESERQDMRSEILNRERLLEELQREILKKEKQIPL